MSAYAVMPEADYKAICDSVRAKTGGTQLLNSGDLKNAIDNISLGVDTSDADATPSTILKDITAYVQGEKITGVMPNRGSVYQKLTTEHPTYNIPTGFHNGGGSVEMVLQSKSVTASTETRSVTPDSGKVLSSVEVNPTPSETASVTPSVLAQTITPSTGRLLNQVTVNPIPENFVENGYKVISGQFDGNENLLSYSISCPGITTIYGLTICADAGNLSGFLNVSTSNLSPRGSSWSITGWSAAGFWLDTCTVNFTFSNEILTITPSEKAFRSANYDYIIIGR